MVLCLWIIMLLCFDSSIFSQSPWVLWPSCCLVYQCSLSGQVSIASIYNYFRNNSSCSWFCACELLCWFVLILAFSASHHEFCDPLFALYINVLYLDKFLLPLMHHQSSEKLRMELPTGHNISCIIHNSIVLLVCIHYGTLAAGLYGRSQYSFSDIHRNVYSWLLHIWLSVVLVHGNRRLGHAISPLDFSQWYSLHPLWRVFRSRTCCDNTWNRDFKSILTTKMVHARNGTVPNLCGKSEWHHLYVCFHSLASWTRVFAMVSDSACFF